VSGFAVNTGGTYAAEDATVAAFQTETDVLGTGVWNFHAHEKSDRLVITGSDGSLRMPVFADEDIHVTREGRVEAIFVRNPPHVHQPLIQTIVDELQGRGRCESTGESGARASWVMDRCVEGYYETRRARPGFSISSSS
jgi:1,5-anhydro-D-fructose reductase (1,5-anhydro-D-mannitol-forming)